MKKSSILAHRGWHFVREEKNTSSALIRAIDQGYGLETDVRDLNGRLVISHDPPMEEVNTLDLIWLLEKIAQNSDIGRIALNVKSDGLCNAICKLVDKVGVNPNRIYVFDMSIPDYVAYINSPLSAYTRISEYEEKPVLVEDAAGVWVDNFTGTFPQVQRAVELISCGIRTALVSPELHRRNHQPLWDAILVSGLHLNPLFELCTDFPLEAFCFFSES